ncbi:MAG: hypothetical protein ACRCWL_13865 [Aeromonas sp.]
MTGVVETMIQYCTLASTVQTKERVSRINDMAIADIKEAAQLDGQDTRHLSSYRLFVHPPSQTVTRTSHAGLRVPST